MNELEALEKVVSLVGNKSELARRLGCRPSDVGMWFRRDHRISAKYALDCHFVVGGEVTAHQLRPDLYPEDRIQILDESVAA